MVVKSFIDPSSNDQFSALRGLDLQELIVQIENFYLSYRDILNLKKDISIGYEIEFEEYELDEVTDFLNEEKLTGWVCKFDGTLRSGGETVSPILHDTKEDWLALKKVCEFLQKKGAITNDRTGGHIHIGAQGLGNKIEAWQNLFLIYTAYEHVAFRFFYADKISPRKGIKDYAKPISDFLYERMEQIKAATDTESLNCLLGTDRYRAINFNNVAFYRNLDLEADRRTVEFRGFNGSTNEVVLQNNALFLGNLVTTSKLGDFDKDYVDYKLEHDRLSSSFDFNLYNEIDIKDALEFADLIFNNNLDKVYFLRQYFKGFQNSYGINKAIESKKFVK